MGISSFEGHFGGFNGHFGKSQAFRLTLCADLFFFYNLSKSKLLSMYFIQSRFNKAEQNMHYNFSYTNLYMLQSSWKYFVNMPPGPA